MTETNSLIERRLRFSWHLDRLLAASARPGRSGPAEPELAWLAGQGIRTIVNLCSSPFAPPDTMADAFEYVHLPVPDCHPPTVEQVERVIELTRVRVGQGRPVLVHCRGGVGRTATVLAPVLMALRGMSLTQAVDELRQAGRLTQSMDQWHFLQEWEKASRKPA